MKETFRNIKTVYQYGKEHKSALIFEGIGSLIGIVVGIATPILSAKQLVYLTENKWIQLVVMSIIVWIVYMVGALKTILIRKNTQKFTVGITEKMQKKLGTEILKVSQAELEANSTGTFIQRMTSDIDELASMFTLGFGNVVGLVTSIGTFISVLIINKFAFIFYFFASFALTLIHLAKSRKIKAKDKEKRAAQEKVTGLTGELVRGSKDIKMLNAKESFIDVLNFQIKNKNIKYLEMRNIDIFYNFLDDLFFYSCELLLILLFVALIKLDNLSVAMAVALFSYRYTLLSNFMFKISSILEEVNNFNLSFERVFALLDNKTFKKEKFGTDKINKINGDFEFKNVSFSYDNNLPVLKDLSFKVKAHSTVGFVGKSGTGKTTIFNLLCKMYDINSGEILIDGKNINYLDEDSVRGNITIIGQSPYIFHLSIIDNMKLVKKNVTLKEIKEACKLACLDEFIESLPDKYNSVIGEGGVNLSGGQKQRLAIARALIQKTEIILFDEATSALDNETQKNIQDAINNLKGDYTIMIIAHRFSTIMNCDKIFFIDDGKILASGTHKELLKKCEEYKYLYEAEIKDNN